MYNQLFLEAIVQISVHGRFCHKLETLATSTLNSLIHEHLFIRYQQQQQYYWRLFKLCHILTTVCVKN